MSVWKRGAQPYKPEAVGRGSEGIYTGGSVCVSDLQSLQLVRFVEVCIKVEDTLASLLHKPGCMWSVMCVCQLSRVDYVLLLPFGGRGVNWRWITCWTFLTTQATLERG